MASLAIMLHRHFLTERRHFRTMSLQKLANKLYFAVHFIGVVVTNVVTVTSVFKNWNVIKNLEYTLL